MSENKIDTHELTINGKKCTAFPVADIHPDDLEKYKNEFYFWWGDMDKLRETVPDVINGWIKTDVYKGDTGTAAIESDRIEVVTEHVEATVMDALQALVENGGKPVEGWRFSDHGEVYATEKCLSGVNTGSMVRYPFYGQDTVWKQAFRPVTRVRIKAEPVAKDSLTPEAPETAEDSSVVQLPDLMGLMTKREAFAMAAMQGICSDSRNCGTNERRAANAVAMADALLAELEKGKDAK